MLPRITAIRVSVGTQALIPYLIPEDLTLQVETQIRSAGLPIAFQNADAASTLPAKDEGILMVSISPVGNVLRFSAAIQADLVVTGVSTLNPKLIGMLVLWQAGDIIEGPGDSENAQIAEAVNRITARLINDYQNGIQYKQDHPSEYEPPSQRP